MPHPDELCRAEKLMREFSTNLSKIELEPFRTEDFIPVGKTTDDIVKELKAIRKDLKFIKAELKRLDPNIPDELKPNTLWV